MRREPMERFAERFPRGCSNCGASKSSIVVQELVGPYSGRRHLAVLASGVDLQRQRLGPRLAVRGLASAVSLGGILGAQSTYFAECQACHEAWLWRPESETWVNTGEVQKRKRARGVTNAPGDANEKRRKAIGTVY